MARNGHTMANSYHCGLFARPVFMIGIKICCMVIRQVGVSQILLFPFKNIVELFTTIIFIHVCVFINSTNLSMLVKM